MTLPFHPYANIFPLLEGGAFDEFVEDIRRAGQRVPVVLLDGTILDGRNRHRACERLGRATDTRDFDPEKDGDPLDYVISLNLQRRHESESQLAMHAAELAGLRPGRPRENAAPVPVYTQAEAAERFGVGERSVRSARKVLNEGVPELKRAVETGEATVKAAAAIAALPAEEQQAVLETIARDPDTKRAFGKAARAVNREKADKKRADHAARRAPVEGGGKVEDLQALIDAGKTFPTIYADPPWTYQTYSYLGQDRSASQHYETMSTEDIAALPVRQLAASSAILHLWCLSSMVPEALGVIEAWDFKIKKIGFVWGKLNQDGEGRHLGQGHWTRDEDEFCLLATRGTPLRLAADVRQHHDEPRGDHSAKPDEFRNRITRLTGGPYLELFGRKEVPGWTVWGNQVVWKPPPAPVSAPAPSILRPVKDDDLEIPAFLRRQAPGSTT